MSTLQISTRGRLRADSKGVHALVLACSLHVKLQIWEQPGPREEGTGVCLKRSYYEAQPLIIHLILCSKLETITLKTFNRSTFERSWCPFHPSFLYYHLGPDTVPVAWDNSGRGAAPGLCVLSPVQDGQSDGSAGYSSQN